MHAGAFFNPHHPQLLVALIVLAAALLVLAAAAPELGSPELPFFGDGGASSAPSSAGPDATPGTWATDPLRPPMEVMAGR